MIYQPKMSIYIVKHKGKNYLFLLKDEYHHPFLNFWKTHQNETNVMLPDDLRKGIKHCDVVDIGQFDTPFNVAERYQSKVCVHGAPLWWHLNTETMRIGLVPQD